MTGQRRWTLLAAAVAVVAGATIGGAMPVAASPAAATSCTPIASAQVQSILRENWELPSTFLSQDLHTHVYLKIDPTGHIVDWRIVRSSGNPVYDDTVHRAVAKTQIDGFPAPDPEVYETIKDGYTIDFNPASFFSGDTG